MVDSVTGDDVKKQVEQTLTSLSNAIESIHIPGDSTTLPDRQLKHVSRSALNLEATIIDCLC